MTANHALIHRFGQRVIRDVQERSKCPIEPHVNINNLLPRDLVSLPNITNVFYGRDVGYMVERIVLDEASESISASNVRQLSASPRRRQ